MSSRRPPFRDPDERLRRIVKGLTGGDCAEAIKFFATIDGAKEYFQGTSIQALGMQYRNHRSGLFVPANLSDGSAPIDLYYKYIPWSHLFDEVVPLEIIISLIQTHRRDDLIANCAYLADMSHPGNTDTELNDLVAQDFPALYQKAEKYLKSGNKLFGPQAALVVAKLAILRGESDPNLPVMPFQILVTLFMAIQDHFYSPTESNEKRNQAVELVANTWFHRRSAPVKDIERFEKRWMSPHPTSQRIKAAFHESTGISVELLANLAALLFTTSRIVRSKFKFEPPSDATDAVEMNLALSLLSANSTEFQSFQSAEIEFPSFAWDFSAFHQSPIYRREDGDYSVFDISMVMRRCLGWSLVRDAEQAVDKDDRRAFRREIELLAESHVYEQFSSVLGKSWADRIVPEEVLLEVLGGEGIKTADLAIEYPNSWLVVEVSATRPRYQALAARSSSDYESMINQAIGEGEQALSTCMRLLEHADKEAFEFRPISPSSKMYPLVVLTEGFPVGPFSLSDLRAALKEKGCGSDPRIAPVEVVDSQELEMLLSLSAKRGMSIVDLFEAKKASNFWSDSVNNFLMMHHRDDVLSASTGNS